MSSLTAAVTFDMIVAAAHRIRGHVQHTPLKPSARITHLVGGQVLLKMENLHYTGAFKERGTLNKLKTLTIEEQNAGVYTASTGNHAQGLAYHAGKLGVSTTVFMPINTPVIKVKRTEQFGAKVVLAGNNYEETLEQCLVAVKHSQATMVYDSDPEMIAGGGTVGLEIMNQDPHIDMIVVPVGSGALISGIALAAKEINPRVRIVGVEPARNPSVARRLAGDTTFYPPITTIADSINVRHVPDLTAAYCRKYVDELVTVTDEDICKAMLLLLEGEKCVAEGGAAVSVAALLAKKIDVTNQRVCALITGGNVDVNILSMVIEKGLVDNGRRVKISMDLPDKPGSLSLLMQRILDLKANMYVSFLISVYLIEPSLYFVLSALFTELMSNFMRPPSSHSAPAASPSS
jgi:threonine dehydratase